MKFLSLLIIPIFLFPSISFAGTVELDPSKDCYEYDESITLIWDSLPSAGNISWYFSGSNQDAYEPGGTLTTGSDTITFDTLRDTALNSGLGEITFIEVKTFAGAITQTHIPASFILAPSCDEEEPPATTTPLTGDLQYAFEIILVIMAVVILFFFIPWITDSLVKKIPKDPFKL